MIKAVLADALGCHLDAFQRIVADPASASVVRYTATRPFVLRSNDTGDLLSVRPPPPAEPVAADATADGSRPGDPATSDAVVGGSAGTA